MSNSPETTDPDDLRIIENLWVGLGIHRGLYPRDGKVSYAGLLRAAATVGRGPAAVAARLTALGYTDIELPESSAELPAVVDEQDVLLVKTLERVTANDWGWWTSEYPLKLEHILHTASLTGRSPADVASRLTAFGYEIPEDIDYPKVRGARRR